MGKTIKTIYFCDLCRKESVSRFEKCPFCQKDFCEDCGLDVWLNLSIQDIDYKTSKDFYARKDLVNKTYCICDDCQDDVDKIKETAIKIIKGEVYKKEFKVEASD